MATDTSAELGTAFDGTFREGGLDEFEPENQRPALWLRVPGPDVAAMPRGEPYVAPSRRRWWPLVVPLTIMAALIAGVTASWVGMRANEPLPPTPSAAEARGFPRADTIAPAAPAPLVPAPALKTLPPAEPPLPQATAPAAAPAPQPSRAPMDPAFEQTLAAVSQAYRALDATSLTDVWPGADVSALAQSFSGLKYQALSFEACDLRPNGPDAAIASCAVSIAAAPNAGDPTLQRRRESWTLVLNRSGERWTITGLSVR